MTAAAMGNVRGMHRAALAYAETAFPAHRINPVRTVESRHSGGRTVLASYHSLAAAADAAAHLPTRAEWDEIEVVELLGPEPTFEAPVDPEGPAGLTPRRVGAGAAVGALVGAAAGLLVGIVADLETPFLVGAIVMGAVLAGIVGLALSGVARYGGANAAEQTPAPNLSNVALLTVWTPDERVANIVAHALGSHDAIEVRIADDEGHWHSPRVD